MNSELTPDTPAFSKVMPARHSILKLLALNCSEVAALLSEDLDQPLPLAERTAVELHAAICAGCRRYRRQVRLLRRVLSRFRTELEREITRLSVSSTLPPHVRDRLKQALRNAEL